MSTAQGGYSIPSHVSGPAGGIHSASGKTVQGVPVPSAVGNIAMNFSARPRHPNLSLSLSAHSGESNAADYQECGLSPRFPKGEPPPWYPTSPETAFSQARDNAMMRYKEKKKARK